MAPALSDREQELPSHPLASRDSLHEADMWAVEGLTHRYPTKVLAELIPTCPQYCGHCTRMDLVGNDTVQVLKYKFEHEAGRTLGRDARLPPTDAERPRRGRVRRRHGERPDQAARGVRDGAARHRAHPRHPPGDQGPDGDPAAFPAGRGEGGGRADGHARERTGRRHRRPHPRERGPAGDPVGGPGDEGVPRRRVPRRAEPGSAPARGEHDAATAPGALLHAPGSREDPARTTSTSAT